jgi:hypothetical protein
MELFILKKFIQDLGSKVFISVKRPLDQATYAETTWKQYKAIKEVVDISIPKEKLWVIGYWNLKRVDEHSIDFALSHEDALTIALNKLPEGKIAYDEELGQWEVWEKGEVRPSAVLIQVDSTIISDENLRIYNEEELSLKRAYIGLQRCEVCNQYKGYGIERWANGFGGYTVSCICDGILCKKCGINKVRKPIANYWDEINHTSWHVPYFASTRCSACE